MLQGEKLTTLALPKLIYLIVNLGRLGDIDSFKK